MKELMGVKRFEWVVILRKIEWKVVENVHVLNPFHSSESATTAPVTTAQLTVRWTRWTTGTSRTIPSPGWDITWPHATGGARTTRGAGGRNPARWWWRYSRGPRDAWSPIPSCSSLTCTRRWRPTWTSRGNPCGDTCSSTRSTTHLTCLINNCTDTMGRVVIWWTDAGVGGGLRLG